jgi:N-acyl-L-homoserine lactone synthetase
MLIFFNGYERTTRPELFDAMFRHRKSIFIDQKKWPLEAVNGEFEIDEFDRDDTVYVCSLLPDGTLAGSARVINTTTDHMANTAFKGMFPGLTIQSPTIWEVTRYAVPEDRRIQPNGVSRAACEIILGTSLFALEFGVSQFVAIYEPPMARIYRKCGLRHYVLGRHRSPQFGAVNFGLWDVSREHVDAIRAATGLTSEDALEIVSVAAE